METPTADKKWTENNGVLVLITGAASGLGLGTAQALAADGYDVVVHERNPSRIADGDQKHKFLVSCAA